MNGAPDWPGRVVDREQCGWHLTGTGVYETYPVRMEPRDYDELQRTRSPLRPVVAMPDEDSAALQDALMRAENRAVPTLMVAVAELADHCAAVDGFARRLVAGRPGSWESEALPRLAFQVATSAKHRAGSYDKQLAHAIYNVLHKWIFDGRGYVEVAESLCFVFGRVVDKRGGWDGVTAVWSRAHQRGCRDPLFCNCWQEALRLYLTSQSTDHYPGATELNLSTVDVPLT